MGLVWSAVFSPDGKCIVSASGDKTIHIWNPETGKMMLGPLNGHTGNGGVVDLREASDSRRQEHRMALDGKVRPCYATNKNIYTRKRPHRTSGTARRDRLPYSNGY
jgi:hypothetical protein